MAPGRPKIVDVTSFAVEGEQHQSQNQLALLNPPSRNDPPSSADSPSSADPISSENEESMPRKRGREMARGFYVAKRVKEGKKIGGLIFNPDNYVVVGPTEKIFKMEIGIITRTLAPFEMLHWHMVKKDIKKTEELYRRLQSEFDIDMADPHVKEVVDAAIAKRFRSFKHQCHKYYLKFDDPGDAIENPIEGISIEQWVALCKHFESDKFKKASAANKKNRDKVQVRHTSGSKSICQRIYEIYETEDSEDPTQELQEPAELKVYHDTHQKNGDWTHPEAKKDYEQMNVLYSNSIETGDRLTGKQIVEKVVKPKNSYVRGLGYGFRSSTKVRASRELHEHVSFNSELREELENKIQGQQAEIDELKSAIKSLMKKKKKKNKEKKEKFESLVKSLMKKKEKKKKNKGS